MGAEGGSVSEQEFSTGLTVRKDHLSDTYCEILNPAGHVIGDAYVYAWNAEEHVSIQIEALPAEANARLWSKAEVLLEACKAAYDHLGAIGYAYEGVEQWNIMDQLGAAIHAARREEKA